jgi:nucleotide-binding universal stress UspA family protein
MSAADLDLARANEHDIQVLDRPDTTLPPRRGLLVPVANPEGVAPLLAIAFAATAPDDPPTRVVALVRRASGAASSAAPPHPPALTAAIEYAATRGVTILPHSVWSANPGADIIAAARDANVGWILLGYHRAASGQDTMGGVVRDVFATARGEPLHVGVFIQGTDRPIERVFTAVDSGPDGRAALDLAVRIARSNNAKLHALLVSNSVRQLEDDMVDLIRDARRSLGRQFHSDVLGERSLVQLLHQSPGRLLIVGKNLADEIRLPLDEVPEGDRCVIVVQGGSPA